MFLCEFQAALNTDVSKVYTGSAGVFDVSATYANGAVVDVVNGTNYLGQYTVAGGNVEIGANSFVGTELEVQKIAAKDSDDIYSSANIHVTGQIQADSGTFNRLNTRVYKFPTADGTQSGQAIVTDAAGNLSFAFAGSSGIVVSQVKDLADVDNDLLTKRHPDHFLLWDSSYTTHVGTGQYVSKVFTEEVHSKFVGSSDLTYDSATGRFTITNTGVTAGAYGSSSAIPIITVSAQGQIDSIGTAVAYTTSSFNTDLATKSTANLAEGSNLYYTNARVYANLSLANISVFADVDTVTVAPSYGDALAWNGNTWVPSVINALTALSSVVSNTALTANTVLSLSNFTTANLTEGSRLYYTNAYAEVLNCISLP